MADFCAITPDRGDRPKFLRHCIQQMWSQTLQPGDHIVINHKPKSNQPDLIERIRMGIEIAKQRGFKRAYIIENDDYYPDDYFEKMEAKHAEFVGSHTTIYYHLSGSYTQMYHPDRSSLFTTGFDLTAMNEFKWPDPHRVDLDTVIWQHAVRNPGKCLLLDNVSAIGIKHGIGLCGGRGHTTAFRYDFADTPDRSWLREAIRPSSFDFYMSMVNDRR